MHSSEIRRAFTDFFVDKAHQAVASAPLVAPGDPTLLFTSAGMVPFKPFFLGQAEPPNPRLTSIQKCFRTTDVDEVGDATHLTMFEMLGNFSIGDYFKREAITWAWEFTTQVMGVPADRLAVTVFTDDDDAYAIWRDDVGLPENRIFRYGADQGNYWYAGEEGPCGPCSELHYDMQPNPAEPDEGPADNEDRWLEIWNLVFMQFQRLKDGSKTPLPKENIDTGAGLERWTMMLQDKTSVYETDLFASLLNFIGARCDRDHQTASEKDQRALRVIAEHGRAMTFLVSDGVIPSNEGRGYVLRRLIRRALYMAQSLGIQDPILVDVAAQVRDEMGDVYPEIREQAALTDGILSQEEERFRRTLATGQDLLERLIIPRLAGETGGADSTVAGARSLSETIDRILADLPDDAPAAIPGEIGFVLYDTYGFPPELTREVAAQHGLGFDAEGFEAAMAEQRARGRAGRDFRQGSEAAVFASIEGRSEFSGYSGTQDQASVLGIVVDGEVVPRAEAGQEVDVVLTRSPFYPEGGGQMGDAGQLQAQQGEVEVRDTQAQGDLIVHIGVVRTGSIATGDSVTAEVDLERRQGLMRNHTATHLLHAALRQVLGDHVRQAGSLVAPDRFRFDYTQPEQPDANQLAEVRTLVSARIRDDIPVETNEMSYEDALGVGAMAIFGEKYATDVRVVEICDPDPHVHDCFSKELCGGTHAPRTGFIGGFEIVSEGSVGAGLRRIEAVTGAEADGWRAERLAALDSVAALVRSTPLEAAARVEALQAELSDSRRRLAEVERQASSGSAAGLAEQAQDVGGVSVVVGRIDATSADALREAGDEVKRQLGSGVVVLGAVPDDRPLFVAMVSPDLAESGLHAGNIIREVAKLAGGGGGGKPHMAQAGGTDASKLDEALGAVAGIVEAQRGG